MASAPIKNVFLFEAQGVDNVSRATKKVSSDLARITKSSDGVNKAFRGMRGGAAQLGYQIQDVAVQLQAGQNALLVFGQQGSQVASIMGPGGALIGAVIAVGAAIASSLLPSLKDGEIGFDDLEEQILKTADSFGTLAMAQVDALAVMREIKQANLAEENIRIKDEIANTTSEMEMQRKSLKSLKEGLLGSGTAYANVQQTIQKTTEDLKDNEQQLTLLEGKYETNIRLQKILGDEIGSINNGDPLLEADEALQKASDTAKEFVDSLREQAETYGMNTSEMLEYKMERMALTEVERQAAEDYIANIEGQILADKRLKEAQKEFKRLEGQATGIVRGLAGDGMTEVEGLREVEALKLEILEEAQQKGIQLDMSYAEARRRIAQETNQAIMISTLSTQQASINSMQGIVNQFAGMLDETTALGKAAFVAQKALAAAETFIAYEVAIAKAGQQMGVFGIPLATMYRAQQVAAMAAIAGQTVGSFEGGGITFNGVRSGGMDGKGGKMAVVHPNEKITDLEKGGDMGGGPVNVNFNITANDAKGFDQLLAERRGMIMSLVNKAINNRGRSNLA